MNELHRGSLVFGNWHPTCDQDRPMTPEPPNPMSSSGSPLKPGGGDPPLSGHAKDTRRESEAEAAERARRPRASAEPVSQCQDFCKQMEDCLRNAVERSPAGTVAAALGIGFILGMLAGKSGR